jgi:hypothetical protein
MSSFSPVLSPSELATHPNNFSTRTDGPPELEDLYSSSPRSRPISITNPAAESQPPEDLYSSLPRSRHTTSVATNTESSRTRLPPSEASNRQRCLNDSAGSPTTTHSADSSRAPVRNDIQASTSSNSPQLPELDFQSDFDLDWNEPQGHR